LNSYNDNVVHPEDQPLPKLRSELIASKHIYDGQPHWVLKDPMSLRYYKFNREEYFIIDCLREGTTLRKLKDAHRKEFGSDVLNNQEVSTFVTDLAMRNLLLMAQPDRDQMLYDWAEKRRKAKLKGKWTSLMYIKIPLYDPDKLLDKLIPHFRFVWSWSFLLIYVAIIALALWMLVDRWDAFYGMMRSSLFTIYNIPVFFAAMWIIKCLHELGHALSCKNYGGGST